MSGLSSCLPSFFTLHSKPFKLSLPRSPSLLLLWTHQPPHKPLLPSLLKLYRISRSFINPLQSSLSFPIPLYFSILHFLFIYLKQISSLHLMSSLHLSWKLTCIWCVDYGERAESIQQVEVSHLIWLTKGNWSQFPSLMFLPGRTWGQNEWWGEFGGVLQGRDCLEYVVVLSIKEGLPYFSICLTHSFDYSFIFITFNKGLDLYAVFFGECM